MKHTSDFEPKFEKLNNALRITFYLLLLSIFFGGTFVKSSQIYANDTTRPNPLISLPYFETPIIEKELYPKTVFVKDFDSTSTHLVYSVFAKDVLKEVGMSIDSDDEILPSPEEKVPNNGIVVVVKVENRVYRKLKGVPFNIKEIEDENRDRGDNKILVKGMTGVIEDTFKETSKDGTVFKNELIKSETIIPMRTQVVRVGTKPVTVHNCSYWNRVIEDVVPKKKHPQKNAWMKYIMYCETGCDSGQITRGKYYGLYQFAKATYRAYGGENIFDGYEQIEIVSKMYDMQGNPAHHWPSCNRAFERDYNR